MNIASQSTAGPYQQRSRLHLKWAAWLVVLVVVARFVLLDSYYFSKHNGAVIWFDEAIASTFETKHQRKNGGSYYEAHYTVAVSYKSEHGEAFNFSSETKQPIYSGVKNGLSVPFWVVAKEPGLSEIGLGATLGEPYGTVFSLALLLYLFLVGSYYYTFLVRPWYFGTKQEEVVKGRLP